MKKLLLWAAVAMFVTTACTKDDSLDGLSQRPISFDASIGKSTKATVAYPTSTSFGVTAYYKPEGAPSYQYEDENTYFKNLEIKYDGSKWGSESVYYWPTKGSLKFAAYSPYNKATMSYSNDDGLKMTFKQDNTASVDLMYTETTTDITGTPNPVPLVFNHQLTQLYFTMKTSQLGYSFRIKELSLQTVFGEGTFKTKPSPTWTTSGTAVNYTVYSAPTNGVIISANKEYPESGDHDDRYSYVFPTRLFVIPQAITTVKIYIKYDMLVLGNVNTADAEKTITLTGSPWGINQKIEYEITISQAGTEITYNPSITDWGAEIEKPTVAN